MPHDSLPCDLNPWPCPRECWNHAPGLIEDIDADTEEMPGGSPSSSTTLKERPDLFIVSALADGKACRPESLDPGTAGLMAVTAAAAVGAPDYLRVHIRAALLAGASRDAIRDCLVIARVIGKGENARPGTSRLSRKLHRTRRVLRRSDIGHPDEPARGVAPADAPVDPPLGTEGYTLSAEKRTAGKNERGCPPGPYREV